MPGELVSQLDRQRTNRTAEHGVVRDDVGRVACLEDGDAHHSRLLWSHPAADDLLHGRHEQRTCRHRVTAGFGLTRMAAASGNRDREARVGSQNRSVTAGGAAEGNGRPVVIAEDALHSVERALVDHLPGAEPTLLGRLKQQRHGPVQRSLVLFEPRCGGQEAGGVPVVPASVHPTRFDRCVRQLCGLGDGKSIDIGSKRPMLSHRPPGKRAYCAGSGARTPRDSKPIQLPPDVGGCPRLVPRHLGMAMEFMAHPHAVVDDVVEAGCIVLGHQASHLAGATPAAFCPSAGRDTLARN